MERRVATLQGRRPRRAYLPIEVNGRIGEEPLTPLRERQEDVMAEAERLDGRHVLGTTDPTLDAEAMRFHSKQSDVVEKRFAHLKAPLAARPLYLNSRAMQWCGGTCMRAIMGMTNGYWTEVSYPNAI